MTFIIVSVIITMIVFVLAIHLDRNFRNKMYKAHLILQKIEIIHDKVIDLIIKGNIAEAKRVYNTLPKESHLRWFLNGLLIGVDVKTNQKRLLENKYNWNLN